MCAGIEPDWHGAGDGVHELAGRSPGVAGQVQTRPRVHRGRGDLHHVQRGYSHRNDCRQALSPN